MKQYYYSMNLPNRNSICSLAKPNSGKTSNSSIAQEGQRRKTPQQRGWDGPIEVSYRLLPCSNKGH